MGVQDEVARSRVTLQYKTEVNGEEAVQDLPFRQLVVGDFSAGTSKDRGFDLENRAVRSFDGKNTSELIKDMGIKIEVKVPNKIDPSKADLPVSIAIEHKNSFSPKEIAKQVPQIRSLLMAKQLLLELQSNIANKKELGTLLNKLYANKAIFDKLRQEDLKQFAKYQLPLNESVSSEKDVKKAEGEEE